VADFEFLNRPWDRGKVRRLIGGLSVPDGAPPEQDPYSTDVSFVSSGDGMMDVSGVSWFQSRCRAYDYGDVDALFDVIQLEGSVSMIPDPAVRAAVTLAMMGWDDADIGAALRNHRPASKLVEDGVRHIVKDHNRER
jgi:hypothetical protein